MKSGETDGLSDILREMAEKPDSTFKTSYREAENTPVKNDPQQPHRDTLDAGTAPPLATALPDKPPVMPPRSASGTGRQQTPYATLRHGHRQHLGLKTMAMLVLSTVGMLLLIPAVWALLLLAGAEVWNHDRTGAHKMALLMLICWPIAFALLCGAVYYFIQIKKHN